MEKTIVVVTLAVALLTGCSDKTIDLSDEDEEQGNATIHDEAERNSGLW